VRVAGAVRPGWHWQCGARPEHAKASAQMRRKGRGRLLAAPGERMTCLLEGGQIIITIIVDGVQRGPNTAGEAQAVAAGEL